MSTLKERHYWSQLRAALTAGQWRYENPAKLPNGSPLCWSELFRKFNKHCRGYQDVAEVASQTQALGLLLAAEKQDEDGNEVDSHKPSLFLDGECLLPEEKVEEARERYETLKALETSRFDTISFALAYYAYALGNPADCLAHLERVPELLQFQEHIPTASSTQSSSHALVVPSLSYSYSTTSFSGSFTSIVDTTVPEVRDGRGWAMTETFRSLCLQGMSYELLHPSEPQIALKAYSKAIPLFSSLQSEFSHNSALKSSGKLDFGIFNQLRELWRWVERLLWRAIVLSSRGRNLKPEDHQTSDPLWVWLSHYNSCSACWPPNFRASHRSTIVPLHIRCLVLCHGFLKPIPGNNHSRKSPPWLPGARSIIQDYRAVLSASTIFPCAGQQNTKVEEFVDLCVAVWEAAGAHGEHADWVIDILWWATRLTFNSSRVLRHMTRLLHLSGDTTLAKRTLRLYIQVVGKAYQASKEGVGEDKDTDEYWVETLVFGARMLCKAAANHHGLEGIDDVNEGSKTLDKARTRLDVKNKRLLASVELAEGIVESLLAIKGQDPLTRTQHFATAHEHFLRAVWEHPTPCGNYHTALSFAARGPAHDAQKAVEYAGLAVEGDPQEVRYWHLLGILLTKIEKWKEAVVILENGAALDGMEAGNGETEAAEGDSDQEDDEGTVHADTQTLVVPGGRGLMQAKDFAMARKLQVNGNGSAVQGSSEPKPDLNGNPLPPFLTPLTNSTTKSAPSDDASSQPAHILPLNASELPPASTLLRPDLWCTFPPSPQELFEYHLQLRMTQVAVTEVIEGAEGAEVQWVDIFAWVAERKGSNIVMPGGDPTDNIEAQRQSFEGARQSVHTGAPLSDTMHSPHIPSPLHSFTVDKGNSSIYTTQSEQHGSMHLSTMTTTTTRTSIPARNDSLEPPIPITISPATPDQETRVESVVSGEGVFSEKEKGGGKEKEKEKKDRLSVLRKRSTSIEGDTRDTSKSKKVGQMLKNRVHKGRVGITAVSKRLGHGVARTGGLRRSSSTPDFHAVLQNTSYQASSIHSRRRLSSIIHSLDRTPTTSPPPPPSVSPTPTPHQEFRLKNDRSLKDNRLLSELWLMSAATFRRLGKIEQTKGAIQEAEVRDENNANVWVQFGLYYVALELRQHAMDTFQKALFVCPDDVAATVHLARLHLDSALKDNKCLPASGHPQSEDSKDESSSSSATSIDLAAGMLSYLTKGRGWDVPEAWYFLAKAYGLQGRKAKERETLAHALSLSERRGVRDIGIALGWCV